MARSRATSRTSSGQREGEGGHQEGGDGEGDEEEPAAHGRLSRRGLELDAHAAHGVQVAGLGGGLAELAAQPRQVDVDRLVGAAVGLAPHLGEQLAPGHHLGRAAGEVGEQVELEAGQLERLAVEGGRRAGRGRPARSPTTMAARPSSPRPGRSAQDGPDAGVELGGGVRLDDVVVGAGVEQLARSRLRRRGRWPRSPAPSRRCGPSGARRCRRGRAGPRSSTTTSGCQSTTTLQRVRAAGLGADGVAAVGQRARRASRGSADRPRPPAPMPSRRRRYADRPRRRPPAGAP